MRRAYLKFTTLLTLTLLLAPTTFAQYQVNNRNVLDRNLQRGSGGINPVQQSQNYGRAAEAIVTGRSAGLSAFRGIIDYAPAGEFSGELSTDDLFNIERRSLPQGPLSSSPSYSLSSVVKRSTSITSGDVANPYNVSDSLTVYRPSTFNTGNLALGQTNYRSSQTFDTTRYVGLAEGAQGRLLELNASPLTGVTYQDYEKRLSEIEAQRQTPAYSPQVYTPTALRNPLFNPLTPTNPTDPTAPNDPNNLSPIKPAKPGTTPEDSTNQNNLEQPGILKPDTNVEQLRQVMLNPGVLLAQQIEALQQPQAVGRLNLANMQNQLLQPAMTRQVEPGQDPYIDLLNNIREKQGLPPIKQPEAKKTEPDTTTEPTIPDSPLNPDNLTDPNKPNTPNGITKKPDIDPATGLPKPATFDELMKRLQYEVDPLTSLSGRGNTAFNQAMRNAERSISDGKFFDADRYYRNAMILRPTAPMAMVGRLHAQIGAGMYHSAAHTLRTLYARHPELIAAKYTQPLLPSEQRLTKVREVLLDKNDRDDQLDAPLLLAYLAYQSGNKQTITEQLDLLSKRSPKDPILPLIRGIWLKETSTQSNDNPSAPKSDKPKPSTDKNAPKPQSDSKNKPSLKDLGDVLD